MKLFAFLLPILFSSGKNVPRNIHATDFLKPKSFSTACSKTITFAKSAPLSKDGRPVIYQRKSVASARFGFNFKKSSRYDIPKYMALGLCIGSCTIGTVFASDSPYDTIYYAAKEGNISSMKKVLEEYPNLINRGLDRYDSAALHIASQYAGPTMIKFLLNKGAAIDNHRGYGPGALHLATRSGRSDNVRTLLKHGADVNLKDLSNGYTALHDAAERGYTQIAKMLINYGADKKATTYWNLGFGSYTPRDLAKTSEMKNLLR